MKCYFRAVRCTGGTGYGGRHWYSGKWTVSDYEKEMKTKVLNRRNLWGFFVLFSFLFVFKPLSCGRIVILGNHIYNVNTLKIAVLKE